MQNKQTNDDNNFPPHREKLDTDITHNNFICNWRAIKENQILERSTKSSIWKELEQTKGQKILIEIKKRTATAYILPQENIPAFKQWLQKEKGITVLDNLREKQETDLTRVDFSYKWQLEKDGQIITLKKRLDIWDELQNNEQNILIRVKSGRQSPYVLPKENIPAFQLWLYKEKDIFSITDKAILIKREKLETDLTKEQFIGEWFLEQDCKIITDMKYDIWNELVFSKSPNLVIKVQSGNRVLYVLPQENIPAFKQWLQKEKGITVLDNLREKQETDLTRNQILQKWNFKATDKTLPYKDQIIWENLIKHKILIPVKAEHKITYVLPKENIPLFKQWLSENQISVSDKAPPQRKKLETDMLQSDFITLHLLQNNKNLGLNAKAHLWNSLQETMLIKVSSLTCTPYVLPKENMPLLKQWLAEQGISFNKLREKLRTDISKEEFIRDWQLNKNSIKLAQKDKKNIWDELVQDPNQTILVYVQSMSKLAYILPKENCSAMKQWLKEKKGIEALSPLDRLYDLQQKFITAETEDKKNKYLFEAEILFRSLRPEFKEENLNPAYFDELINKHR